MANVVLVPLSGLAKLRHLLWRFPVPSLLAVTACAYALLELHSSLFARFDALLRLQIGTGLAAAFLAALASDFVTEARAFDARVRIASSLAASVAMLVLIAIGPSIDLNILLLFPALVLLVGLLPFAMNRSSEIAYWHFNHDLWIAAATGIAAGLLFAAGLTSIRISINFLFNAGFGGTATIWVISMTLVAPFCWLVLVPAINLGAKGGYGEDLASRAIEMLAKYLLVPLLVTYALVLHAYALKIALEVTIPKGLVGWMVLTYGALLSLASLLVFPIRDQGRLVGSFRRFWPLLLAVPTCLLFLAGFLRVDQYGFTEARYFLLLTGAWFAFTVASQCFEIRFKDIRVLVGSLAVLLALAAAGPWGMAAFPPKMQAREYFSILSAAGLLDKSGRIDDEARTRTSLQPDDNQRLDAITNYLSSRRKLTLLSPLFRGLKDNPFETAAAAIDRKDTAQLLVGASLYAGHPLAGAVRRRLQISSSGLSASSSERLFYMAKEPFLMEARAKAVIAGPVTFARSNSSPFASERLLQEAGLRASFDGKVLLVHDEPANRSARFDIVSSRPLRDALSNNSASRFPAISVEMSEGTLPAALYVTRAEALREGEITNVHHLVVWIVVDTSR